MVQQLSVFLENKPGILRNAAKILANANINMRALSIADTSDFGILRLIVDKPQEALGAFQKKDIVAKITEVLAVEVADVPVGMERILATIEELDIDLEYLYAFLGKKTDDAIIIFNVANPEEAAVKLEQKGVHLVKGNEICNL
ncbi:MAG: amino acid-binding protein [Clostridiales bacterium]